jgi:predicted permease
LAALFGPAIVGPMIATILIDMFVTSSLCIAVAQAGGAAGGARVAAVRSLRGAVSNPLPWAIALGGALGAVGWRPVGPVDAVIKMLADAASPVALFTIGAVLWRAGQHTHSRTAPKRYVPQALAKLLLHPVLVFGLSIAARAAGAPLSDLQVMAITLTAALPSAANVAMLAERFGADNGRIARIILTSTVLSFVTFTSLATWFGGRS